MSLALVRLLVKIAQVAKPGRRCISSLDLALTLKACNQDTVSGWEQIPRPIRVYISV
jgi:hypothetical protein